MKNSSAKPEKYTFLSQRKLPIGALKIFLDRINVNSSLPSRTSNLKCIVWVENKRGQAETLLKEKLDWRTEFKFPISNKSISVRFVVQAFVTGLVSGGQVLVKLGEGRMIIQTDQLLSDTAYVVHLTNNNKLIGDLLIESVFIPREDIYHNLIKILREDRLKLLPEILNLNLEFNLIDQSLLRFFWYSGLEDDLLLLSIRNQIASSDKDMSSKTVPPLSQVSKKYSSSGRCLKTLTIFRGVGLSVNILSEYIREIGRPYLYKILGRVIRKAMNKSRTKLEINPRILFDGEICRKELNKNINNLTSITQKIFNSIVSSIDKLPTEIVSLCQIISKELMETTDKKTKTFTVLGTLLFLRFFTPAISAPESYGLVDREEITPELRRGLILVAKVLQTLVNRVEFGEKEQYMICMNPFLKKNKNKLRSYYKNILKRKIPVEKKSFQRRIPNKDLYRIVDYLDLAFKKGKLTNNFDELQSEIAILTNNRKVKNINYETDTSIESNDNNNTDLTGSNNIIKIMRHGGKKKSLSKRKKKRMKISLKSSD